MPGDSGVLVVTRVRSTNTNCTRGRGCNGHPAFPTPSKGRKVHANLGRIAPRDREVMFGIGADTVIPGRCQRVRAKRGPMTGSASNPESRDSGSGPADHPGMTVSGLHVIASEAKQSILAFFLILDCFAEPVIRRAFVRPVGSQCRLFCMAAEFLPAQPLRCLTIGGTFGVRHGWPPRSICQGNPMAATRIDC